MVSNDAKLGIFIHWGPFSIPAYAPLGHGDIQELLRREGYRSFFRNIPYSEWYIDSIRIEGSPAYEHHRRTYSRDASYFDFAQQFKRDSAGWQADAWADLFQAAGARYVVLVAKHMDGFLMWPSATPNYARQGYQMERDVVGELTGAVKARGMRMGVYYSSALDQSFTSSAMADLSGLLSEGGPIDRRYGAYSSRTGESSSIDISRQCSGGTSRTRRARTCSSCSPTSTTRCPMASSTIAGASCPIWLHRFVRTRPGRALLNAYATRLLQQGATGSVMPLTSISARLSSR